LIERVGDFEAHQNERCDHQIKAEMHERFETRYFSRPRRSRRDVNEIRCVSDKGERPATAVVGK
jgi:hypothetical protein